LKLAAALLPPALFLAACAQEGVQVHVYCYGSSGRDCGSIAVTSMTPGNQTVSPTTTVTVPVSALPGGGVLPLAASVNH
jgi:hypothetical protein